MFVDDHHHQSRAAAEAASAFLTSLPAPSRANLTRQELAEMGRWLWERSYRVSGDDLEAYQALYDHLQEHGPQPLLVSLYAPHEQIQYMWAARWVDQNFPQITMGHKYCAALLATAVTREILADVQPPWRAFLVVLPDGLLSIKDGSSQVQGLTRLHVQYIKGGRRGDTWNFTATTDDGLSIWRHGLTTEELISDDLTSMWEGASFIIPEEDHDRRTTLLLGRLIINICLAMSDPTNVKPPRPSKSTGTKKGREDEPKIRSYELGAPIKIDCRQAIRDYVAGTRRGGAPTVQTLVRGHWKRQAHGEGRKERKLLFIEPYWRGNDEAPVLVRPHVLGGNDAG